MENEKALLGADGGGGRQLGSVGEFEEGSGLRGERGPPDPRRIAFLPNRMRATVLSFGVGRCGWSPRATRRMRTELAALAAVLVHVAAWWPDACRRRRQYPRRPGQAAVSPVVRRQYLQRRDVINRVTLSAAGGSESDWHQGPTAVQHRHIDCQRPKMYGKDGFRRYR